MTKKQPKIIVRRPIGSLKPHAEQAELFGDVNDASLQLLADSMDKNGQNDPAEILPDGTIICGHQRVRAGKRLGWEMIDCWVREDLAKQGPAAIKARLIEDNLHRRQLSLLGIARCYLALKEAALENGDDREDAKEDLRDHLAKRFKKSGKQMERYVQMLDAPPAVQHAFEADKLTQKDVLAVVALDADEQQQIVQRIEDGEIPKAVVKPYRVAKQDREVGVETAVKQLTKALETAERQIASRLDEIVGCRLRTHLKKLLSGARFVKKLHKVVEEKAKQEEIEELEEIDSYCIPVDN